MKVAVVGSGMAGMAAADALVAGGAAVEVLFRIKRATSAISLRQRFLRIQTRV